MGKQKETGSLAFEKYYQALFLHRWDTLKEELLKEPDYLSLENNNIENTYFLDSASVLAAESLPLLGAKNILDMCAAPGGKSLVLAKRMAEGAQLTCNEISPARHKRLTLVLQNHLNAPLFSTIRITRYDGRRWSCYETNVFDRILLDAPCSSERHVLKSPTHLADWSYGRIKNVTAKQWALFSSAFRLLKNNGYLLYVTCALSPAENDEIIKKALKKFANAQLAKTSEYATNNQFALQLHHAEKTECGYRILPDTVFGAGPIYFSLIKKKDE